MTIVERPQTNEHHEYFTLYTSKVPDGNVLDTLEAQIITGHVVHHFAVLEERYRQ